jgi:small subunit ribosomal protein S9
MKTKNKSGYGLGRRKEAIAKVYLREKSAGMTINSKDINDYLGEYQANIASQPLKAASLDDKHGFAAKVKGGGKRAQADAVRLGLARAILTVEGEQRSQLKALGMLTRDARVKERKKAGLKRARRAPQFSKR